MARVSTVNLRWWVPGRERSEEGPRRRASADVGKEGWYVQLMRLKEIAPWRPFGVIDKRLRALFDELNEERLPVPSQARAWIPAVELVESDDELLLTAELPWSWMRRRSRLSSRTAC